MTARIRRNASDKMAIWRLVLRPPPSLAPLFLVFLFATPPKLHMATSKSDLNIVIKYLGLPQNYDPSPSKAPLEFLKLHLRHLPPEHLCLFSSYITTKQRTDIPAIRNRRLRYVESEPSEFSTSTARETWPTLWQGLVAPDHGRGEANEEKEWADKEFLPGKEKQLGKLGDLLRGYEEERGAERARAVRRKQREFEESLPEEDEDTDDEDDLAGGFVPPEEELSPLDAEALFKRRLKERFIYGLLDVSQIFRHAPSISSRVHLAYSQLITTKSTGMINGTLTSVGMKRTDGSMTKRRVWPLMNNGPTFVTPVCNLPVPTNGMPFGGVLQAREYPSAPYKIKGDV